MRCEKRREVNVSGNAEKNLALVNVRLELSASAGLCGATEAEHAHRETETETERKVGLVDRGRDGFGGLRGTRETASNVAVVKRGGFL